MKHILITAFSILSLAGRAQDTKPNSTLLRCCQLSRDTLVNNNDGTFSIKRYEARDTIRAILLVTYNGSNKSIAHTKPGYVVRVSGVDKEYLDDKKKPIKLPTEVWNYKIR